MDVIERTASLWKNPRTGEWYFDPDTEEDQIVKALVEEVERLRAALADARRALNGGYNTRALNIINKAEGN